MKAATNLVVLSLDRYTFVNVLGPLQDIMNKEKSAEVRYPAQLHAALAAPLTGHAVQSTHFPLLLPHLARCRT